VFYILVLSLSIVSLIELKTLSHKIRLKKIKDRIRKKKRKRKEEKKREWKGP
jgi:hypothetical protein